MAAAAGSKATATTTQTRTPETFSFPLTLAKARAAFATIDQPFILKLAAIAKEHRPQITDAELADCVVKKHGQKSEGLFFKTVGPRVQALNEYDAELAAQPKETEYVTVAEWNALYGDKAK